MSLAVGDWGIGIEVPSNAQSFHEAEANRHSVAISQLVSVTFWRIPLAMPETIAEAKVSGPNAAVFDQGTTDGGILYAVQSLRVRDGFRAGTGTHVHFYRTVGRVFALLPLDANNHVRCTGYVERSVESADDADLETVRKICLSMRRR